MRSTSLSSERRAGRYRAVALLGATMLAACNDERPVEPLAPAPAITTSSAPVASSQRTCVGRCTPIGQIVFAKADPETKPTSGHIWIMNADTTGKTQITFGTADDDYPAWSPNYKKVVFSTNRRGAYEIFVVNADGTGLAPLTSSANGSIDLNATWAPDGSKIYFTRARVDAALASLRAEIYSVNADGTGLAKVSNDTANLYLPSVSPDGKKIAVARLPIGASWDKARLNTMNTDGSGMTMLTDGWLGDGEAAWSPDGTKVAFTCREGLVQYRDICVVNADGTNRITIVGWQGQQANPSFSRDGSRVVFESYASSAGTLFSVKPDGSGATQLTSNLDPMAYYSAAWSR
jgi:Tol biopolymer transport system component